MLVRRILFGETKNRIIFNLRVNTLKTKNIKNKKVLLRERKRHTAHRVASARYADLSWGGVPRLRSGGGGVPIPCPGGYPVPCPRGVTPSQVQRVPNPMSGGLPHPRSRGYPIPGPGGYPIPGPGGTPSHFQGVPHPRVGGTQGTTPSSRPGRGPPHLRPEMGYPPPQHLDLVGVPPPHKCEQTENITFPHPSDGGR